MVTTYMHKIEKKNLWKEVMSCGGNTWYMGGIFEELNKYASIWINKVL